MAATGGMDSTERPARAGDGPRADRRAAVTPVERYRQPGWTPRNLRKPGLAPATVIDVGAASGTHPLYAAFPEAHHVLIDPLTEYAGAIESALAGMPAAEWLATAVGDAEGSVTMRVDHHALGVSSILRRSHEPRLLEEREVPITTLDTLRAVCGWKPPFGLKIDSEGYEHRVISGAAALLGETQFVIAEVSTTHRHEGSYTFAEFIALMDSLGFGLCDVLEGSRSRARRLNYLDAMFTPDGTPRERLPL